MSGRVPGYLGRVLTAAGDPIGTCFQLAPGVLVTAWHVLDDILAQDLGDYDEAARQYQRALDIRERLGDQAGMAGSYHQLGRLAQLRGDYDEAIRRYQRALDINERIGNRADMATTYSQLGNLASDRGGPATAVIAWHVKALVIRLRLGVPRARNNLRLLSDYRRELGDESFADALLQAAGDAELAETITSRLDQFDGDTA